jgi:transposase
MRGEVLGAERRRRWTAEQKTRIVAESFGSGEPVSWVARRHERKRPPTAPSVC